MAIPGGGFKTESETRPPTLEELIKILSIAKNFKMEYSFESDSIHFSFRVDKHDCVEQDLNVRTVASKFLGQIIEHLGRLFHFDEMSQKYSNPDVRGTTASDLIAFLNNELKFCTSGSLQDNLRRRMFTAINAKMAELQEWRVFVDAERFAKRAEEARQQKAQAEAMREEIRRQQRKAEEAEREAAAKAKQEKQQRTGKEEAQYDFYRKQYEETFKNEFENAFKEGGAFGGAGFNNPFEEMLRRAQEQMRRQAHSREWWENSGGFSGTNSNGRRPGSTFTWGKKKWHEVLGVNIRATKVEIKAAWRKLAKEFHPDRNKAPDAAARMAEINAAKDEGLSGASS